MTINPIQEKETEKCKLNKIYLVYAQEDVDCCPDSWVVDTFGSEEEAKHYVDIYNQLCVDDTCGYKYYYREQKLSTFDLNTTVAKYYCYSADVEWDSAKELRKRDWIPEEDRLCMSDKELEEKYNHPDYNRIQDDELYVKIDKGDFYVDVDTHPVIIIDNEPHIIHIEAYSKNSLEEARQKCLEIWEKEIQSLKEHK